MGVGDNPHIDISDWKNVGLLVLERMESHDKKFDRMIEIDEQMLAKITVLSITQERHNTKMKFYDALTTIFAVALCVLMYKLI